LVPFSRVAAAKVRAACKRIAAEQTPVPAPPPRVWEQLFWSQAFDPLFPRWRRAHRRLQPEKREPKPVGFVCEEDVRAAVLANSKIVIGKKTIITPSAREIAEANDVFVLDE